MSTLVYDPYRVELPAFFDLPLEVLMERKHPTAWLDFERGDIDAETFAEIFLEGVEWDYRALEAELESAYRFLPGIEPLLDELQRAGVTMYSLSNYPVWSKIIERKLELSRYMPWDFVSWKTGVRKPDIDAYLGPAKTLGVAPAECLFVDDRRSNCEAAERAGMIAAQFENASQLRADLVGRGLLENG